MFVFDYENIDQFTCYRLTDYSMNHFNSTLQVDGELWCVYVIDTEKKRRQICIYTCMSALHARFDTTGWTCSSGHHHSH